MIRVDNLSLSYGDKCILSRASFEIKAGEISFIIGKNGTGKTTLANILCGLNYDYRGDVVIDGKKLTPKTGIDGIRRLVGMVFQNPDHQIIMDNVYDEMKFTISNFLGEDDIDATIHEQLSMVGLEDYIGRGTFNLSGGEKQRLNIASTLVTSPRYIILDEATSMLDDDNRSKIYELAVRLKHLGKGVIFTTNHISELFYADSILIIHQQKVFKYSKTEIIKKPDILKKYGFEIPLCFLLERKLREMNIKVDEWKDLVRGIAEL